MHDKYTILLTLPTKAANVFAAAAARGRHCICAPSRLTFAFDGDEEREVPVLRLGARGGLGRQRRDADEDGHELPLAEARAERAVDEDAVALLLAAGAEEDGAVLQARRVAPDPRVQRGAQTQLQHLAVDGEALGGSAA